jgi:excinuclease ABC subunit C
VSTGEPDATNLLGMKLNVSLPFDPISADQAFWNQYPNRPAVFALFPRQQAGTPPPRPYLALTADLKRRLLRLLGQSPETPSCVPDATEAASTAAPVSARSRVPSFRELICRIEYQPVGSKFEAQWLLYELNRHYYPDTYRQRLRLRPTALLKINLKNRFPRCYPTRKLIPDGSLYYGPFASRIAADRFAAEFLDLFMIRRCLEDLNPDPNHPGCIYSQMHMCLAPCFAGCTDDEYGAEVGSVRAFLDSEGLSQIRSLEAKRTQASEALEFEQAGQLHRKLDRVRDLLKLKPALARNIADLNAIILQHDAEPKRVVFFRVIAGELSGPAMLSFDERVASPVSLDQQILTLVEQLTPAADGAQSRGSITSAESKTGESAAVPPWEHLSILARWYYSRSRQGEIVLLSSANDIPHARIIRLCRKLVAETETGSGPVVHSTRSDPSGGSSEN